MPPPKKPGPLDDPEIISLRRPAAFKDSDIVPLRRSEPSTQDPDIIPLQPEKVTRRAPDQDIIPLRPPGIPEDVSRETIEIQRPKPDEISKGLIDPLMAGAGGLTSLTKRQKVSELNQYLRSALAGTYQFGATVARVPSFLAAAGAYRAEQLTPGLKVEIPKFLIDNPVATFFDEAARSTEVMSEKYGVPQAKIEQFIESKRAKGEPVTQADIEKFQRTGRMDFFKLAAKSPREAADYLAHQVIQNAPYQIMTLALTLGSGGSFLPLLGGATTYAGAQKMGELSEDQNLEQKQKTEAAVLFGLSEAVPEFLSFKLFPYAQKMFQAVSPKVGKEVIKKSLFDTILRFSKGTASQTFSEAAEEYATEIAQSLVQLHYQKEDQLTTEEVFRNAREAALIGGISGGIFNAPAAALSNLNRIDTAIQEGSTSANNAPVTRQDLVRMQANLLMFLEGVKNPDGTYAIQPTTASKEAMELLTKIEEMLASERYNEGLPAKNFEAIAVEATAEAITEKEQKDFKPEERAALEQELKEIILEQALTMKEINETSAGVGKGANLIETGEGFKIRSKTSAFRLPDGTIPSSMSQYMGLAEAFLSQGKGDPNLAADYTAVSSLLRHGNVLTAADSDRILQSESEVALSEKGQEVYGKAQEAAVEYAKGPVVQKETPTWLRFLRTVQSQIKAQGRIDFRGQKVTSAQEIAYLFSVFRHPALEQFHSIYLDDAGKILAHTIVTSGDIAGVEMKPQEYLFRIRDRAERTGAKRIVLLHNHPSGRPDASREDANLTLTIAKNAGGIPISHIIINDGEFSSLTPFLDSDGQWKNKLERGTFDKTKSYELPHGAKITMPEQIISMFKDQQMNQNVISMVLMNSAAEIMGVESINNAALDRGNLSQVVESLKNQYGARHYILVGNERLFNRDPRTLPVGIRDIIQQDATGNFRSLREARMAWPSEQEFGGKMRRVMEEEVPYAPVFYSDLLRAIEQKVPESATAAQILATVRNAGVKQEEIDWTGFEEFLKTKEKFKKQEILDFIHSNQIEIEEVKKGGGTSLDPDRHIVINGTEGDILLELQEDESGYFYWHDVSNDQESDVGGETVEEAFLAAQQAWGIGHAWNLRAGDDLPQMFEGKIVESTKFESYQLPGGTNYRELLLILPKKKAETFKSPHFDEPNVLAHVRMNDRVVDGNKTLFIEEIQSDWHQQGRRKGYQEAPKSQEELLRILDDAGYNAENNGTNWVVTSKDGSPVPNKLAGVGFDQKNQFAANLGQVAGMVLGRKDLYHFKSDLVPNAPFKKTWHELVLKRVLRMAAEEGYDAIAWTTGDQQAERYDLSKQLDSIQWERGILKKNIGITGFKNGEQVFAKNAQEENLADWVGKELAEKILTDRAAGKEEGEFSGIDLKVGGKGMREFYDNIIPQFLNKYTKKWGGRVEKTAIKSAIGKQAVRYAPNQEVMNAIRRNDNLGFDTAREAAEAILTHPDFAQRWDVDQRDALIIEGWREDQVGAVEKPLVHSLDITPSMKVSVLQEGQGLFREPPEEYGSEAEKEKMKRLEDLIRQTKERMEVPEQMALAEARKVIKMGPDKKKVPISDQIKSFIVNVRTDFISEFLPVKLLEKQVYAHVGQTAPTMDLAKKLEQVAGARGRAEADIRDYENAVVKPIKKNYDDFSVYLFLNRTISRLEADPEVKKVASWTIDKANLALAGLEKKVGPLVWRQFRQIGLEFQKQMDKALILQVDSGRMSKTLYQTIKDANDFYAPFKVLKYFEEMEAVTGAGGRNIATTRQLTQAITGIHDADFKILDILTSAAQQIYKSRLLAEKNLKMQEVANLTKFDKDGLFIRALRTFENPKQGMEEVKLFQDGKRVRLEVTKDVADALTGLNHTQAGTFMKVLSLFAAPLRAGVTVNNLDFQIRNLFFADLPRAGLMSKYGFRRPIDAIRFPLDLINALGSSMHGNFGGDNPLYSQFLRSGAANSTVARIMRPEAFQRALKIRRPGEMHLTEIPGDILDTVAKFANAIEETNKVLGLKRALDIEGFAKLSPTEQTKKMEEIAYEVRNYSGSPDFSRKGRVTALFNVLFMFFNARVQGVAADFRRLGGMEGKQAAATAWTRITLAVGLPTLILALINHQDENEEDYYKIPEVERENYFMIPTDKYFTTEEGESIREYYRIPKREVVKLVSNLIEKAVEFAKQKSPDSLAEYAAYFLQDVFPVNIQGDKPEEVAESIIASMNPAFKAPYEYTTGRNAYFHTEVVPFRLKQVSPELQYRANTPEVYKTFARSRIGRFFKVSPLKAELLVRSLTGGLITQFQVKKPELGRSPFSERPVSRIFYRSRYVQDKQLEKDIEEAVRRQADARFLGQQEAEQTIEQMQTMNLEERRAKLAEIAGKNKLLFERVLKTVEERELGLSYTERRIKTLGVENGERAAFVKQLLEQQTEDRRFDLLQELIRKKIVTDQVLQQLMLKILQEPEPEKTREERIEKLREALRN